MTNYYIPKMRCALEQAQKNSEIRGIKISTGDASQFWCEHFGCKASISVEGGWVRGGSNRGAYDDDTVKFILSLVTNCDWVDEHDDAFHAYLNWNAKERLESAEEVAEDIIKNSEMEGYALTEQEAINDELHYELSERMRFGVDDMLPLAVPVKEFELYAPTKPCRVEEALENAEQAGVFTDFHRSGKIDFSFGPLTDEQGPVTSEPVITAVVEDGFIKDAAVYEWAALCSDKTLQAITKCEWY